MATAVRCNTCEEDKLLKNKDINIICCDDTQHWVFSFFCKDCGRIETGDVSEKNLQKLIHAGANIVVWEKPELPEMDGPALKNLDLFNFQELLDSTDYIVELVEAV